MSAITAGETARLNASYGEVLGVHRRQFLWPVGLVVAVIAYLVYAFFAFDVPDLIAKSRLDRGVLLGLDSVAYKVHVEKNLRRDLVEVAVEGERTATYDEADLPDWVQVSGPNANEGRIDIDMGGGYRFVIEGEVLTVTGPGLQRPFVVTAGGETLSWEGDTPSWIELNPKKVDVKPSLFQRAQVTSGRILVFRYFWGWEDFWFDFRSPLHDVSAGALWSLAWSDERLDPEMSNAALIFHEFWTNEGWQHGDVFKALLETVIMAFLGTVVAAFVALPLAFMAAANVNPDPVSRFFIRRFFDFVRGVDMLIWSLIFIRSFGLGPLTGVMAIALTDTGTLGKLFSEAIENIDNKQVEGMQSTGAGALTRYRFGVIPQILPVFISQSLYYLESNTRSATVIGALGAGGIGLKLVETLRTGKDWENTAYIIVLTLIVVIGMDMTSGWLRRKLTGVGRD
ncbi:phosphonate ABC transporter, permease protein PhnE [Thalassobaculum sp. OXR-137]|uniref:phosphonate ABC transporter, permease protein PhnE n=1 Tax=Thalassobaculum sp. OXR-137 TaxID=3100173 RepID=UPI002AC98E84|nr:phosphonate ABC transporter, permease protein PhnE [Thalassobaculum sp. OXR-137]WPZ35264.1 phosphonate ABC transporter, permease protein PhnE [Thalassobaculum sp. OXR-137]